MAKQKKTSLPLSGINGIDVNSLGVSGEEPKQKKPPKKRLSLKQTILYSFATCGLCFFITALFPSNKPPASVPTEAQLPTQVANAEATQPPVGIYPKL